MDKRSMDKGEVKKGFEPEIIVLYCQNCIGSQNKLKREYGYGAGFKARFVMMPCSSKIEVPHILKLLAEGADGLQVVGCQEKMCRFLIGNMVEEKRIVYARMLLDQIKMGAERIGMSRGKDLSESEMIKIAKERAEAVKVLGPSPTKLANVT